MDPALGLLQSRAGIQKQPPIRGTDADELMRLGELGFNSTARVSFVQTRLALLPQRPQRLGRSLMVVAAFGSC